MHFILSDLVKLVELINDILCMELHRLELGLVVGRKCLLLSGTYEAVSAIRALWIPCLKFVGGGPGTN